MDYEYVLTFGVRYLNIFLGATAMWALWQAKEKRSYNWTTKMRSIWLSLFLFTYIATQGNVELLWRHVHPTVASYLTAVALANVVWHSLSSDTYTKDEPRYHHN